MEFKKFPSINRLTGPIIVTEKIDGTNACVVINEEGWVRAQSRTRFITPQSDNFGFANWVYKYEEELRTILGVGYHYGEWWGKGIQRSYGLSDRKFSLFNTSVILPENDIVNSVPILATCIFDTQQFKAVMDNLKVVGSFASPGYMNPEGIVIYDTRSGTLFKKTYDYDETGKQGR